MVVLQCLAVMGVVPTLVLMGDLQANYQQHHPAARLGIREEVDHLIEPEDGVHVAEYRALLRSRCMARRIHNQEFISSAGSRVPIGLVGLNAMSECRIVAVLEVDLGDTAVAYRFRV
jgi:hypothetical protein